MRKKFTEEEKKARDAQRHREYYAKNVSYIVGQKPSKRASVGGKVWRSPESIEKRRIYSKEYWARMPEEERLRRQRNANKKSWKKEYLKNKDYYVIKANNRRIEKLGNGGKHTAKDIDDLWVLQNGKCTWCLKKLDKKNSQVDHKIPIKLGGRNDKGNLQLLHAHCNKSKAAKHPSEYGLKNGLLAW